MTHKKSVTREYYEAILVAFILALFVRTFVFENFKIPSGSMKDNLLIGDHLVVNKLIFARHMPSLLHLSLPYREPRRGDVVVFKYPYDRFCHYIHMRLRINTPWQGQSYQFQRRSAVFTGFRIASGRYIAAFHGADASL